MVRVSWSLQSVVIDLTECGTPGLVTYRVARLRGVLGKGVSWRSRCAFRVTANQFRELIDGVDDLYADSTQNQCSCYLFVASVCGRTGVDLRQGSSGDDAGISRRPEDRD